ncbi:MAG TPA: queuosine precursor transporter [Xanthomonadales bacterium]|nr:queuosine precursor transporter [Xanthomonadales bacterium]
MKNSKKQNGRAYKYLDIIILLDVAMMIIANTTAGKITQLWIFTVSVTVFYFPFTYILGDLLTEVYGYQQARRATWILIAAQILTAIIYSLVVIFPPAHGFKGNEAYTLVLGQAPRIVIGGFIGLFVGQFVNDFVLAKMKVITKGKYLWIRTISSTITGQFFDTTLFYSIALSNVIPAGLLLQTILSGWFLKVLVEALMTPVTYYVIGKLKKAEKEDFFDVNTNFNPLVVSLKQGK